MHDWPRVRTALTGRAPIGGIGGRLAARLATLAVVLGSLRAGATQLPTLVVEAPAQLAAVGEEVRAMRPALARAMELTGLEDPGPPIRIVIASESSPAALSAPAWVSGYADSRRGVVVLMPARARRYPDDGLQALLVHEVTHILVDRAAAGEAVPRWFDEGLAMAAGRSAALEDRARVALAVLTDSSLPLYRIDQAFAGGSGEVAAAYALARDFVRVLLQRFGEDVPGEILAAVARGESFSDAFRAATGERLGTVEAEYWRRRSLWDRWIPLVTSGTLLWTGITMLALAAFRSRRRRDEEIRQRWRLQEELATLEAERLALEAGRLDDEETLGRPN